MPRAWVAAVTAMLTLAIGSGHYIVKSTSENLNLKNRIAELENEDTRLANQRLAKDIEDIRKTYTQSIAVYQNLLDLKLKVSNTSRFDQNYAEAVKLLSETNFASAAALLEQLDSDISEENAKIAAAEAAKLQPQTQIQSQPQSQALVSAPANNTPPASGYSRQVVSTDAGNFTVSLVAADIGSTRVIVDTASDGDCHNDCPVLPLATYVSRNNAYAGINGTYFCPASYPDCAGKTNTFDLLVMNKNKTYFNSDNNVYSANPGVIFGNGYIRFVSAVSQWGRDTSIDGMLSNYPLLLSEGNIIFGGNSDPKQGSRGNRSFVANRGNTVYIGVVHSATVAESARVLKSLDMENGLNLDNGGSTALYSGGYKLGPGRDLPNAILFVAK